MKVHKSLALVLTVVMILLMYVQPIFAFTSVKGDSTDESSIKAEEEPHDGSGTSAGKGGTGQGGSTKGGKGGTGQGSSAKGGKGDSSESGSGKGGSGGSSGSGGGKPPIVGTSIALNVTVEWPEDVEHPDEVDVTLVGADSSDTMETVNSKVVFNTKPGDEWSLVGEAISGFIIPIKNVELKGTDEDVEVTLTYKKEYQQVEKIELNKTEMELFTGDSVNLIATVYPANANEQEVEWESSSTLIATVNDGVVTAKAPGDVTITAKSKDNDIKATCDVTVNSTESAVRVTGLTLDTNSLNLNLGDNNNDQYQFIATISPTNATVTDVLWLSSDSSVATVDENGLVTAKSIGFAVVTAETVDGGYRAYAQVSVGMAPEISYIFPCLVDNDNIEHFDNPKDVYINVVNLVEKLKAEGLPEAGIIYYVKVTEKGSSDPLGEGSVTIYNDTTKFSLFEETKFESTDNFSNRYFVYMSQYDDYPKDDEKTLKTSFMGGSATPTIPIENVRVNVVMYGGSKTPEGIVFLLTREELFNKTLEEVSWRDFYNEPAPANPYPPNGSGGVDINHFVDEVKMLGIANSNGVVNWMPPRETLKLGGYLLLEVTPLDYIDNLDMENPDSDDGELLKQVSLKRDGSIDVIVTNIYIGQHTQDENPNEGNPGTENPNEGNSGTDNLDQRVVDTTKSDIKVLDEVKVELATIEDLEKFQGHWSKKYIDNISQKGKLSKNIFNKITNLNDEVYMNDIIELTQFIYGSDQIPYDDSFTTKTLITRQQATVMLLTSVGIEPMDNPILDFIDGNEINVNFKGYIAKAKELGIISGYPDNTFRPNLTLTKAELFTMISKCLDIKE